MPCSFTQARCHIDLSALLRNFRRCGKPEKLMPVLKSDAYGHGILRVAEALTDAGARRYAVGCADEGRFLREAGHREEILPLLPPASEEEWTCVREYGLTPLVCSFEGLERAAAAGTAGSPLPIAVKVETGMHRMGFRAEQIPALIDRLHALPAVRPVIVASHCSCADSPDKKHHTARQIGRFSDIAAAMLEAFPGIKRSLFNSAGTLDTACWCDICDIARLGLMLYGGNPFAGTSEEHLGKAFEWVMSLSSVVLQVTELKNGESVSYGKTFKADREMRLAVVSVGYANGMPRALSGRLHALIHGRRVRAVGRVCMNMTMFDVTDLPGVRAGDEVWLLGGEAAEGERPVTPFEWASLLDTIPYEIVCAVGVLNPRVYHG